MIITRRNLVNYERFLFPPLQFNQFFRSVNVSGDQVTLENFLRFI